MKNLIEILWVLMLMFSFSSCLQDKIIETPAQKPSGDLYVGTITYTTDHIDENMNTVLSLESKTNTSFYMDEERYFGLTSETGICTDMISIIADSIQFKINNSCACWCDCDPRIDCGGYQLFGQWKYSKLADSLILERNSGIHPNPYVEISFPYHKFTRSGSRGVFVKTVE